ncbi:MAG: hypothetical protein ABUS79_20330, partial [Pseudomonadota bacterium]
MIIGDSGGQERATTVGGAAVAAFGWTRAAIERAWAAARAGAWGRSGATGGNPANAAGLIRPSEVGVDRVLCGAVLVLAAFGSVMI